MNNYWAISLIVSVAFHATFLTGTAAYLRHKPIIIKNQKAKEIEMTPREIKKEKEVGKREKIDLEIPKPLPFTDNIVSKLLEDDFSSLEKPQAFDRETTEVIFLSTPPEEELKKNPAYMNYCRLMREKIRANTYHNYNTNKKGEILAKFLVNSNGVLERVELSSESVNNKLLKDIVLKSIKEAAPFPAFPPELEKYSALPFRISIYFKNN